MWIHLANAGTVPVEHTRIALSGKHHDTVISIAYEILNSALPLKPGGKVTIPVTLKAWQLGLMDPDTVAGKSLSGSMGKQVKDGSSPMLLLHYAHFLKVCERSWFYLLVIGIFTLCFHIGLKSQPNFYEMTFDWFNAPLLYLCFGHKFKGSIRF